jgi:predicted ATPase
MIVSANMKGFKRFALESFDLAKLTVLTGLNGSGKTSFLQAVMLAAEATTAKSKSLRLNGPFGLELGTAEDVLNWESTSPIEISFREAGVDEAKWQFDIPSEDALYLDIIGQPATAPKAFSGTPRAFTYLSAERLGPRGYTATSPLAEAELEVGVHGEYCAHVLSVLGNLPIAFEERSHPLYEPSSPRLLKYEVEQWLSEIARPIEVAGIRAPGATVAALEFRTPGSTWVRSTNMGFGITYALPIVLAGLIAEKGGLLLVENPEAHLHPAGQSRMGVFLAWLAGREVQTVIETHSDHVVNGIRRGIAEHQYLDSASAVLHWFGGDTKTKGQSIADTLSIGESGNLSDWPNGFFDQYQIDVSTLGRIRRGSR